MNQSLIAQSSGEWKNSEKIVFRIFFIYFVLQAVPLDWKYYRNVFRIDWHHLHYRDLFYIARYTPQFSQADNLLTWGLNTLQDWAIILLFAIAGAGIWSYYDRKRKEYNNLYYLLRVILRYRLAIGVMAYGFIKVFALQMPYPSLSLENTSYGDLSDWKIAYVSYGVAPSFESYLGIVEILAGALLLNRRSASIGAVIVIGGIGNVFLSNLAYNGGEAVYSLYLLAMATVILVYDVFRWHAIIMLGKPAFPNTYRPAFYVKWKKSVRIFLRLAFTVFLLAFYGYYSYALYRDDNYQYPKAQGLSNAEGLYNVSEFRINGIILPYSLTDSLRWQNVVFEKWPAMSIRSNQPVKPWLSNTEEIYLRDEDRIFESSGSAGRRFYRYANDPANKILYLENKNKHYTAEKFALHYYRPNSSRIILSGLNEKRDSIYVVLDKIKKIYLLDESYKIPKKRSVFQ